MEDCPPKGQLVCWRRDGSTWPLGVGQGEIPLKESGAPGDRIKGVKEAEGEKYWCFVNSEQSFASNAAQGHRPTEIKCVLCKQC